jgi:hypothetical protein
LIDNKLRKLSIAKKTNMDPDPKNLIGDVMTWKEEMSLAKRNNILERT